MRAARRAFVWARASLLAPSQFSCHARSAPRSAWLLHSVCRDRLAPPCCPQRRVLLRPRMPHHAGGPPAVANPAAALLLHASHPCRLLYAILLLYVTVSLTIPFWVPLIQRRWGQLGEKSLPTIPPTCPSRRSLPEIPPADPSRRSLPMVLPVDPSRRPPPRWGAGGREAGAGAHRALPSAAATWKNTCLLPIGTRLAASWKKSCAALCGGGPPVATGLRPLLSVCPRAQHMPCVHNAA